MIRFRFNGINNLIDPSTFPITFKDSSGNEGEIEQAIDIVNFTIDNNTSNTLPNMYRRDGYTKKYSGAVYSGWSNNTVAYCVHNGVLCKFIPETNTLLSQQTILNGIPQTISIDNDVVFTEVNDVIAFTDGTVFGLIDKLGAITLVNDASQWTALEEPTQWASAQAYNTWYESHKPQ